VLWLISRISRLCTLRLRCFPLSLQCLFCPCRNKHTSCMHDLCFFHAWMDWTNSFSTLATVALNACAASWQLSGVVLLLRKHWTSSSRSRPSACHAGVSFLVILTILVSSSSRSLINVALCETPPTLPSPESAPDSLSRFSFSRARSICSRISASRARRRETSDRILAWIAASKEACRSELGAPGAGGLLARWFTSDSPTCEMEVSAPCLPEVGCRARD